MFSFGVWVCVSLSLQAAESHGRITKVLRHLLDLEGRHTVSPSLLDRDAYQAHLREHLDEVSGMRFHIQWKLKSTGGTQPMLRVEVRHGSGNSIKEFSKSVPADTQKKRRSRWQEITITGSEYAQLGEVIAWRVSLWDGETLLAAQESFLW